MVTILSCTEECCCVGINNTLLLLSLLIGFLTGVILVKLRQMILILNNLIVTCWVYFLTANVLQLMLPLQLRLDSGML